MPMCQRQLQMAMQWVVRMFPLRSTCRPMHTRCARQWRRVPRVMQSVRMQWQAMRTRVPQVTCLRRRSQCVRWQRRCLAAILG